MPGNRAIRLTKTRRFGSASAMCGARAPPRERVACRGSIDLLDKGMFVLNARVLSDSLPADGATPLLTTVILDAQGRALAEQGFATSALVTAMQYQNLHVAFGQSQAGPVSFEVRWAGQSAVQLDYVEVFRAQRRLLLDSASGVFDPAERLVFELTDPPADAALTIGGFVHLPRLYQIDEAAQAGCKPWCGWWLTKPWLRGSSGESASGN